MTNYALGLWTKGMWTDGYWALGFMPRRPAIVGTISMAFPDPSTEVDHVVNELDDGQGGLDPLTNVPAEVPGGIEDIGEGPGWGQS